MIVASWAPGGTSSGRVTSANAVRWKATPSSGSLTCGVQYGSNPNRRRRRYASRSAYVEPDSLAFFRTSESSQSAFATGPITACRSVVGTFAWFSVFPASMRISGSVSSRPVVAPAVCTMSLRSARRSVSIFWAMASIAGSRSCVPKSSISRVSCSVVTLKDTSAKWFRVTSTPVSVAFCGTMPVLRLNSTAVNVAGLRTVMVSPCLPRKSPSKSRCTSCAMTVVSYSVARARVAMISGVRKVLAIAGPLYWRGSGACLAACFALGLDRVAVLGLLRAAGEVAARARGRARGLELGVGLDGLLDGLGDLLREPVFAGVEPLDGVEEGPAVRQGVRVGAVLARAPVDRQLHGRLAVSRRRLLDLCGERGRVGRRVLVVLDQPEGLAELLHDLRAGLVRGRLLRGRARLRGLAVRRLQLLLEP